MLHLFLKDVKFRLIQIANIPSVLYITGIDSLIESEPIGINIEIMRVIPNFDFPRELYLDEQSVVKFEDNTSNATSWLWNFGDGTTSTERNPSHKYNVQGNYTISLTVQTQKAVKAKQF